MLVTDVVYLQYSCTFVGQLVRWTCPHNVSTLLTCCSDHQLDTHVHIFKPILIPIRLDLQQPGDDHGFSCGTAQISPIGIFKFSC